MIKKISFPIPLEQCEAQRAEACEPLTCGEHGRPRRVADRAASRGAEERCGAALRGHARDDISRSLHADLR